MKNLKKKISTSSIIACRKYCGPCKCNNRENLIEGSATVFVEKNPPY
ncbi:hypothetical protein PV797_00730 [Clostridiaceae bacterium M8S5]|nr:hypothetical protein PV797_00730 [Clostridiaceae bacterium M8S5]